MAIEQRLAGLCSTRAERGGEKRGDAQAGSDDKHWRDRQARMIGATFAACSAGGKPVMMPPFGVRAVRGRHDNPKGRFSATC
jgi:hypothetical protein